MYEAEAKNVRIRMINENMIGQVVCIQGLVELAGFKFLTSLFEFIVTVPEKSP